MGIAKEGWGIIAGAAVLTLIAAAIGGIIAWVSVFLFIFVAQFFRDPDRSY